MCATKPKRHLLISAGLGLLVAAGMIAAGACSSSSSSLPPSSIVAVLTNWPSTMTVSQSVSLTGNVLNDSSNAGIDWSSSVGSFNPAHTANGVTTVFTAPASTGDVTVTATSTADTSASDSATIKVVDAASNAMLSGTYVFQVQGSDSFGSYVAVGTVVADGGGNIISGEQDYADNSAQRGPDPVTGTYSVGPDGHGSMTLTVNDVALPNNGVETFSLAVTSPTHAAVIQFDATASSSGTLDFQPSGAAVPASVNGYYAFVAAGGDIAGGVPFACGGVATLNAAAGTLTNGLLYENDAGATSSSAITGTVTGPDAFGRGSIATSNGFHYAYYIVRSEVLRLVQEDVPTFVTSGTMVGQAPSGVMPVFSSAALTGNYVFAVGGSSAAGPEAAAGQLTANGNGNFTAGYADVNDAGTNTNGSIWAQSNYAIAPNGVGTFNLPGGGAGVTQEISSLMIFATDPAVNFIDPGNPIGGGGALILDFDTGSVSTGQIVPQSIGTVSGNYAINMQLVTANGEYDFVGQTAASGGGTLPGSVDFNAAGTVAGYLGLTGAYTADSSNPGRFTGTLTINSVTYNVTFYEISSGEILIIDTDDSVIGIGTLEAE
jgi:hypothetical protein